MPFSFPFPLFMMNRLPSPWPPALPEYTWTGLPALSMWDVRLCVPAGYSDYILYLTAEFNRALCNGNALYGGGAFLQRYMRSTGP